jgi:ABC-type transport system substrate-binding protein
MRCVLFAALLLLAGCSGERSADPELAGLKIYRHSMDQAPSSLDPAQGANIYANFVLLNAYDTLYSYKYLARPYQLKPNLAVDFPEISADGLVYTIRIKPGVGFIDDPAFPDGKGREAVAEDFSSIRPIVRRVPGCGRIGSSASTSGRRTVQTTTTRSKGSERSIATQSRSR